jgi:hypothetical protein
MAYAQYAVRDPYPVISWLKKELPEDNYLLSGHSVGYYAINHTLNTGFILANMPPYDYDLDSYEYYYVVQEKPIKELEIISTYQPSSSSTINFDSKTYATLYLMRTADRTIYKATLEAMDIASRKEVSIK